jgi:hypothetical protein
MGVGDTRGRPVTIADLDILIGSWMISGRTASADHDDVSGELSVTPLLGGQVLQLTGSLRVRDSEIQSLESIWHDEATADLPAHVYSGSGAPLNYRWDRNGDTLTHAGLGMTYTGTVSTDGNTITGAWRADPDRPDMASAAYDAVMRRTN